MQGGLCGYSVFITDLDLFEFKLINNYFYVFLGLLSLKPWEHYYNSVMGTNLVVDI